MKEFVTVGTAFEPLNSFAVDSHPELVLNDDQVAYILNFESSQRVRRSRDTVSRLPSRGITAHSIVGTSGHTLQTQRLDACVCSVAVEVIHAKVVAEEGIKTALLRTGKSLMAEASPFDCVWGIGLARASSPLWRLLLPPQQTPTQVVQLSRATRWKVEGAMASGVGYEKGESSTVTVDSLPIRATERSGELSLLGHDHRPQPQCARPRVPPPRIVWSSRQLHGKRASTWSVGTCGMTGVQWHALVTPLGDAVSIAVP